MQDSINQAEQDALLGRDPSTRATPFDFTRQVPHSRTHLRSLKLLHDNFSAPLSKTLAAVSGLPCKVKLKSLAAEKFVQAEDSVYASYRSESGKFLLGFSRQLGWLLLERLLGGKGGSQTPGARPHTPIERRVLSQLLLRDVGTAYAETWARIKPVEFTLDKFEDDAYLLPGLSRESEAAAAVFSVRLGETDGEFSAVLPFEFLKPLMPEMDVAKMLRTGSEPGGAQPAGDALMGVSVGLKVFVGRIEIKLRDLNGLAQGDVLRLDARPDEEVVVEVEGQPRFAGKAGRVGKGLGVQITRTLEPENKKDGEKNGNRK